MAAAYRNYEVGNGISLGLTIDTSWFRLPPDLRERIFAFTDMLAELEEAQLKPKSIREKSA